MYLSGRYEVGGRMGEAREWGVGCEGVGGGRWKGGGRSADKVAAVGAGGEEGGGEEGQQEEQGAEYQLYG